MEWTHLGAAENLVQHAHPGMKPETEKKLEVLASDACPDPKAQHVAQDGLANYHRLVQEQEDYERRVENGWDNDYCDPQ